MNIFFPIQKKQNKKKQAYESRTLCLPWTHIFVAQSKSFLLKVEFPGKTKMTTIISIWSLLKKLTNLTKVLGRGAVVIDDCHDAGPEHLQGGNVGREDAESAGECGDVDLLHTGLLEKHLQGEGNTRSFIH